MKIFLKILITVLVLGLLVGSAFAKEQERDRKTDKKPDVTAVESERTKPVVTPAPNKPDSPLPSTSPEAGEAINWWVIGAAGGTGSSIGHTLSGTVGQTAVSFHTGGSHQLQSGYWQTFQAATYPLIMIEKYYNTPLGSQHRVSITTRNATKEYAGFTLRLKYNTSVLQFISAEEGQFLEDCEWESFVATSYPAQGEVQIVAIADIENGGIHPSCFGPPDTDPYELVKVYFQITSDMGYLGAFTPINFWWLPTDCEVNSFTPTDILTEGTAYLDNRVYYHNGSLIWDENDDIGFPEGARSPNLGAPDVCLETAPGEPGPVRGLDFMMGGIEIASEILTCCLGRVGDANDSGADEPTIGDVAVLIDALFINENWALIPCLPEGDINQSGGPVPLQGDITIGDVSYLIDYLFITGSEIGLPDCL